METKIEETSGTTAQRGEVYCTYFNAALAEDTADCIRAKGHAAYVHEPSDGVFEVRYEIL